MKISVFYEHICEAAEQCGLELFEVLEKVKSLGADAVDVDCVRIERDSGFLERLQNAKLEVASVYKFFDFPHERVANEIRGFIDTAVNVGAKKVLCIPGFVNDDDIRNEAAERIAKSLIKLCDYAEERGVTVTLEDFDSENAIYSTDDGLRWFMDRVPKLRFTFDTGNFMYSEIDELTAFDKLSDRIVHVHLKDRSLEKTSDSFTTTLGGRTIYPAPVGGGCVKMRECIKKLKEIGYDGYYAVEHFGANDQLEYIEKSIAFLRSEL